MISWRRLTGILRKPRLRLVHRRRLRSFLTPLSQPGWRKNPQLKSEQRKQQPLQQPRRRQGRRHPLHSRRRQGRDHRLEEPPTPLPPPEEPYPEQLNRLHYVYAEVAAAAASASGGAAVAEVSASGGAAVAEVSASGAATSRAAGTEQPAAAAEEEDDDPPPGSPLNLGDWNLPVHGMLQLRDGSIQVVVFQT